MYFMVCLISCDKVVIGEKRITSSYNHYKQYYKNNYYFRFGKFIYSIVIVIVAIICFGFKQNLNLYTIV